MAVIGAAEGLIRIRDEATATLEGVSNKLTKVGDDMIATGRKMTAAGSQLSIGITAPLVAAAGAAFTLRSAFDDSLTMIETLVGDTAEAVAEFRGEILELAGPTAQAPRDLADALFFVESAGLRGADSMEVLTAGAMAAAIGMGEVKVIVDAATSAMNAYGPEVLSGAEATNILALAIREGKLEATELAPVIGNLLPLAASMDVSFADVAGTLAVMSRTGSEAAESATSIQAIFTTLLSPTKQMEDAFQGTGLTLGKLRDIVAQPGGIIEVMRVLDKTFQGDTEALRQVVPNVRAFRGAMNLLAQDADIVNGVMESVASGVDILGTGLERVSQEEGFRFKQFLVGIQVNLIKLGDTLAPVFEKLLEAGESLNIWVGDAIEFFDNMTPAAQNLAIGVAAVAAAIGPLLVVLGTLVTIAGIATTGLGVLTAAVASFVAFLLGPVGLIAVGIALLASWKPARDFFIELGTKVFGALRTIMIQMVQMISEVVSIVASLGQAILDIQGPFALTNQTMRDTIERGVELADSLQFQIDAWVNNKTTVDDNILSQVELEKQMRESAEEALKLGESVANAGEEIVKVTKHVTEAKDAFIAFTGDAVEALGSAMDGLVDLTGTMTGSFTDNSAAIEANASVYALLIKTYGDADLSAAELHQVILDLNGALLRGELSADAYAEAMDRLAEGAEEAAKDVGTFGAVLSRVADRIVKDGQSIISIAGFIADAFGTSGEEIAKWEGVANDAMRSVVSFASGDILGGISSALSAISGAFESTSRTIEEWMSDFIQKFRDGTGTLEDFIDIADHLVRTFDDVASGSFDAGRATQLLGENFDELIAIAIDLGDAGFDSLQRIVDAAMAAGVGIELIAERLKDALGEAFDIMQQRSALLIEQAGDLVDGLTQMLSSSVQLTTGEIDFAATSIIQAFNAMIEAGLPLSEVINRMGESFGLLSDLGEEMGIDLGENFRRLGEIMDILSDTHLQNVISRVEGMGAAITAVGNISRLEASQFQQFGNSIRNAFNQLVEGGLSSIEAMQALSPQLQQLNDLSEQYGFALGENTQGLLDMAVQQGVVTERGLTQADILIAGFDNMLLGLNRLIETLGGVPLIFDNWTTSMTNTGNAFRGTVDEMIDDQNRFKQTMLVSFDEIGSVVTDTADMSSRTWRRAIREIRDAWEDTTNDINNSMEDLSKSAGTFSIAFSSEWLEAFVDIKEEAESATIEVISFQNELAELAGMLNGKLPKGVTGGAKDPKAPITSGGTIPGVFQPHSSGGAHIGGGSGSGTTSTGSGIIDAVIEVRDVNMDIFGLLTSWDRPGIVDVGGGSGSGGDGQVSTGGGGVNTEPINLESIQLQRETLIQQMATATEIGRLASALERQRDRDRTSPQLTKNLGMNNG